MVEKSGAFLGPTGLYWFEEDCGRCLQPGKPIHVYSELSGLCRGSLEDMSVERDANDRSLKFRREPKTPWGRPADTLN